MLNCTKTRFAVFVCFTSQCFSLVISLQYDIFNFFVWILFVSFSEWFFQIFSYGILFVIAKKETSKKVTFLAIIGLHQLKKISFFNPCRSVFFGLKLLRNFVFSTTHQNRQLLKLIVELSLRNSLLILAGSSRFHYQFHSFKRYGFQPVLFSDACALDTIMRISIFRILVLLQSFGFLFGTASPEFVFSNSNNNLCYIIALIL